MSGGERGDLERGWEGIGVLNGHLGKIFLSVGWVNKVKESQEKRTKTVMMSRDDDDDQRE